MDGAAHSMAQDPFDVDAILELSTTALGFTAMARAIRVVADTQSSLIDGRDRGYLSMELHSRLYNLARAALRATTNLMLSKQRQANESSSQQRRRARPPTEPDTLGRRR